MWKRTALSLALLVPIAAALLPATGSEAHPFAPGGTVHLSVPVGTIAIHPGTQNRIQLQYSVRPDKNSPSASVQGMSLDFQVHDGSASIRFVDSRNFHQKEPSVDVILDVPAHTSLDLQLGVGKMTLASGWQGNVHIKAGVGDIVVHGATRDRIQSLDASTGVGGIHSADWGNGKGFVAHSLQGNGSGRNRLSAEVGVGTLRLEP